MQGLGAAIVLPLTLTLLSEAVPAERRDMALGIWAGVSGLGVALGPFVGGAVVEAIAWHWIFWLDVPIGLVLLPLAWRRLNESHGLDVRGLALAGTGLFGVTFGIVRATALDWTSATVLGAIGAGIALIVAFVAWELRAPAPMRFFGSRGFAASNGVSLAMFFGVFGAIFLLSQFFQPAQGYSPFEAGLRTLPWTGDADARRADRRPAGRSDRLASVGGVARFPRSGGPRVTPRVGGSCARRRADHASLAALGGHVTRRRERIMPRSPRSGEGSR